MKHLLVSSILGVFLLSLIGCASGPRVTMDPFTPEEVEVLVYAAAATYLMDKEVDLETTVKVVTYLEAVRASVQVGTLDLVALQKELVEEAPEKWQPLANATYVILLKRIHIDQLVAEGEYAEARAYIDAALLGVITAFKR